MVADVEGQAGIYESEDVDEDEVLKGRRQFFVSGHPLILPADLITPLFEIGNDEIPIFIVKSHDTGARFVAEV